MKGGAADETSPIRGTSGTALEVAQVVLSSALFIAYPVVVYFGFERLGVRGAALLMLALLTPFAVARLGRLRHERLGTMAVLPLVSVGLLSAGAALEAAAWVLAVPTVINGLLLAMFAPTLVSGPPMIERFARLSHADLRPDEVRWCRGWTVVWCVFFALNAATAATLAAFAPLTWWVFHTSILGYVLMGVLLGSEWFVRKIRFRRFSDNAFERALDRHTTRGREA